MNNIRGSGKFCQRGSKFDFFLVYEGIEDPNITATGVIIRPPAKHHLNAGGPTMAQQWMLAW